MLRFVLPTMLALVGPLAAQGPVFARPGSPLSGIALPDGARAGDWVVGFGHILL